MKKTLDKCTNVWYIIVELKESRTKAKTKSKCPSKAKKKGQVPHRNPVNTEKVNRECG